MFMGGRGGSGNRHDEMESAGLRWWATWGRGAAQTPAEESLWRSLVEDSQG